MRDALVAFGRAVREAVIYQGQLILLLFRTVSYIGRARAGYRESMLQLVLSGVNSLPIVLVTALASGMVLAYHSINAAAAIGGAYLVGGLVTVSATRELCPVLTAVVVAARYGSAVTAELATMTVTEQVDALQALGVSPVKYLVVPRFLALTLMLPVVTLYADGTAILGGMLVASAMGVKNIEYINSAASFLKFHDVWGGLAKSFFFAWIIALVACSQGLMVKGGAANVGRSTTSSVVISVTLVYIANFVLAVIIFR
jgi:phospholipid/cholesterol/gamma-HCH transport system permease protein